MTRPLPSNAEIIVRQGVPLARWRDAKGKAKTASVTSGNNWANRIRDESSTCVARYRDGNGHVVEVSTQCRDKTAAQSVLADLERRAKKVRSKILTAAEDRIADHLTTPTRPRLNTPQEHPVLPTDRLVSYTSLRRVVVDRQSPVLCVSAHARH